MRRRVDARGSTDTAESDGADGARPSDGSGSPRRPDGSDSAGVRRTSDAIGAALRSRQAPEAPMPRSAGRARRGVGITAVSALLLLAASTGAGAVDGTAVAPPVEDAPAASSSGESALRTSIDPTATPQSGFTTDSVTTQVAPGIELTEFDRFDPAGWIRGDVLTAELSETSLEPVYLHPGTVADRTPLSEQLAEAGAVAGVNGDFFDINATGAPLGVGIDDGELRHAPAAGHNLTAAFTEDRRAALTEVFLAARLTLPDGTVLTGSNLNSPVIARDGIGVFTPAWGSTSRVTATSGAAEVREVELVDGRVSAIRTAPGDGPIAEGTQILLARDAGATALDALVEGDAVEVGLAPRADAAEIAVAVGGNRVLVRDGEVQPVDNVAAHPRTAVGFSEDGSRFWLVSVDGRQSTSRGMTELELAHHLHSLGAHEALNLDGGGSSTLLARKVGDAEAAVHNSPSDGGERLVPNGLGLRTAEGSGRLTGYRVEPAVAGPDSHRVLAGLSRRLDALGHDESGAPVEATPRWRVHRPGNGRVTDGVFVARDRADRIGETTTVTAATGRLQGTTELDVLGRPVRLRGDVGQVALSGAEVTSQVRVLGSDADGFSTWVEPDDLRLDFDADVVRVEPADDGFAVTALVDSGSTVITATAGDLTARIGVTVGTEQQVLDPLDSLDGWQASAFPAVVGSAVSLADGRDDTQGVALDYRLTGTTATRAAYVNAVPQTPLPEGTQRIGLWVNGDGNGAWLRLELRDGADSPAVLGLAASVDWTGWRYVETELPAGLAAPVRLQRFYLVETDRDRQYEGRVVFDDLTAAVSPVADVPPEPVSPDAAVVVDDVLAPERGALRVAVVSDAQFTADDPAGPLVAQARRTLQEALAAEPDLVLINGDLVDRGTAPDFELARAVLDEELGEQVPWYYLPGNHEVSGPGDTSEFEAVFGETSQRVDHDGIRLILLDSSRGTLRGGGFDQIEMLRAELDAAEEDRSVKGVLVALHHPTDDPGTAGNSQLGDQREAELLLDWLSEFEDAAGKPTALVASHAGRFHADRVDGVPRLVNGNAGKSPSGPVDQGGFTGWSLVQMRPADRDEAVRFELRPHVDELVLTAPERIGRDDSETVTTLVRQEDREVPVAYPVSADWSGSRSLHIVESDRPKDRPRPWHVASFDPATGTLAGLRRGEVELSVTVNGVTETVDVSVR
nr:phosphodiester glycosidase family protein [Actinoalloteichus sp. GBA129-24]